MSLLCGCCAGGPARAGSMGRAGGAGGRRRLALGLAGGRGLRRGGGPAARHRRPQLARVAERLVHARRLVRGQRRGVRRVRRALVRQVGGMPGRCWWTAWLRCHVLPLCAGALLHRAVMLAPVPNWQPVERPVPRPPWLRPVAPLSGTGACLRVVLCGWCHIIQGAGSGELPPRKRRRVGLLAVCIVPGNNLAECARHISKRQIELCKGPGPAATQGGAARAGAAHRGVCAGAAAYRRARAATATGCQRARGAAAAALAAARHDACRRAGQPGALQGACVQCMLLVCIEEAENSGIHMSNMICLKPVHICVWCLDGGVAAARAASAHQIYHLWATRTRARRCRCALAAEGRNTMSYRPATPRAHRARRRATSARSWRACTRCLARTRANVVRYSCQHGRLSCDSAAPASGSPVAPATPAGLCGICLLVKQS